MGDVDIEIDGFWCKKCEELHPTLYWHEKFDEYLRNRRKEWDYQKNIRPNLFKNAVYQDCLPNLGLTEQSFQEACVSCGELTYFTSLKRTSLSVLMNITMLIIQMILKHMRII